MTFVQGSFVAFFIIVFAACLAVRRVSLQNLLLVVGSAVFYGWVHPWFLLLLYFSALLDYSTGLAMVRWPSIRRALLAASVIGNLGLLCYFKYFNFFVDNTAVAMASLGFSFPLPVLEVFLPVGISFYTFQTLSYSIDIYRGHLEPRRNLIDYLLYVSFFPQLVAGPVERASHLLTQVERPRILSLEAFRSGLTLALWGAFKKICVADTLAPYVDRVFSLTVPSTGLALAGAFAFSVQILADFSGYTDIARGCARMLGFELMKNFDHPYLAASPSEFWRRWHISFSTWIRDYLYIPLGGSRGRFGRVTAVTYVSMLTSGLWHGAAWTFVLWGFYHASLLTGWRVVAPRIPAGLKQGRLARASAVALMFSFTCIGWLIFRASGPGVLIDLMQQHPLAATWEQRVITGMVTALALACAAPLVLALWIERSVVPRVAGRSWALPLETTVWAVLILSILLFSRESTHDFIYFRF